MKRYAAPIAVLVFLTGCHAPVPSIDLLAPYGATRVPPPATGSYSKPNTYYQPSTRPGATTGSNLGGPLPAKPLLGQTAGVPFAQSPNASRSNAERSNESVGSMAAGGAGDSSVRLAAASRTAETESPIRIVEAGSTASRAATRLNGMPVNDATRPPEPRLFEPPEHMVDISQLPKPPLTARSEPTGQSSSAPTSTSGGRSSSATESSSGWRARTGSANASRVAGRS